MVKQSFVALGLPQEQTIPVRANHTEIVKFGNPSERTYLAVVAHIKQIIEKIRESRSE